MGRFILSPLAALLALTTALAGIAGCGDWKPAPEARLACCAKAAACPMRSGHHAHGVATAPPSQASADACCAASNSDEAAPLAVYAPPAPTWSSAVLALALAEPSRAVARRVAAVESPPPRHAPRHLLLAVFLI